MAENTQAAVIVTDAEPGADPLSWEDVRQAFSDERSYWLATMAVGGGPQVRPVLAVWLDGKAYSTTSPDAVKGRNLARRPECSLAARAPRSTSRSRDLQRGSPTAARWSVSPRPTATSTTGP